MPSAEGASALADVSAASLMGEPGGGAASPSATSSEGAAKPRSPHVYVAPRSERKNCLPKKIATSFAMKAKEPKTCGASPAVRGRVGCREVEDGHSRRRCTNELNAASKQDNSFMDHNAISDHDALQLVDGGERERALEADFRSGGVNCRRIRNRPRPLHNDPFNHRSDTSGYRDLPRSFQTAMKMMSRTSVTESAASVLRGKWECWGGCCAGIDEVS
jgi:hypothetical protein